MSTLIPTTTGFIPKINMSAFSFGGGHNKGGYNDLKLLFQYSTKISSAGSYLGLEAGNTKQNLSMDLAGLILLINNTITTFTEHFETLLIHK